MVAIAIVGAFVFAWLGFLVAGHVATPYIPMISPTPVISGYIGFYSGIIAMGIIPLVLLIFLLFKVAWGYKVRKGVRRAIFGIWVVTFTSFAATVFFTSRNFAGSYTESQVLSETDWDTNRELRFQFDPTWNDKKSDNHFILDLDHAFMANGKAYVRDVGLEIIPTESDQLKIVQTIQSAGPSKSSARRNMKYLDHNFSLNDQDIKIADYYTLEKNQKFRNQKIRYMVHVPVGTVINFDATSSMLRRNLSYDDRRHMNTKKWAMTRDGLKAIPSEEELAEDLH